MDIKLDSELESLARHTLAELFYAEYSELVQKYANSTGGLDKDALLENLQSLSNVYSTAPNDSNQRLIVTVESSDRDFPTRINKTRVYNLADALLAKGNAIHIGFGSNNDQGWKAFSWRPFNGEPGEGWCYNEPRK